MSAPTVAERVAAGAAFLDEHEPGWYQRIDLGRLQLDTGCACVLGQLATDKQRDAQNWTAIAAAYGLSRAWHHDDRPTDVSLGFNASSAEDQSADDEAAAITREYEALTAEWRRVIKARRAVAS